MTVSVLYWFNLIFGNNTNLFCHAVIVGNYNVKRVERQSASAYFTWDITWTLCNACSLTFYWPVKCTPCSCWVWPRMGHIRQKKYALKIGCKNFSEGRCFHVLAWYVYRVAYCVTNFELVWNWIQVAVAENAKQRRLYPTFPNFLMAYLWIYRKITINWE